jgi:hypothetical protein
MSVSLEIQPSRTAQKRDGYKREANCVFSARLFSSSSCRSIVRQVRSLDAWEVAQVVVEGEGGTRDLILPESRDAFVARRDLTEPLHQDFESRVHAVLGPLIRETWGADLTALSGTQLVRYRRGGHYVPHTDSDQGAFASRYFTVLCYLNDDFEGGGTSFPSLSFRATPVSGRVLVFPSQYWHCAEPVTRGEKLVFLSWVCGPVPIRWI